MSNMQQLAPKLNECPCCDVKPGEYHRQNCHIERCPRCAGELHECRANGCPESMPGEIWPPPLDDRNVWTGELPNVTACREFGWFAKRNPSGSGYSACDPDESGAMPDLLRLVNDADWDRREMKYVRTNLNMAFDLMLLNGIYGSRARHSSRRRTINYLTDWAMLAKADGLKAIGFAFYTIKGKWRMHEGKDFALHFGQFQQPNVAKVRLPDAEVGAIICGYLDDTCVKYRWDGDSKRPIRIMSNSIVIRPNKSGANGSGLRHRNENGSTQSAA